MYSKYLGKRVLHCYISGKNQSRKRQISITIGRFMLRGIKTENTTVSCKLKNAIKIPRSWQIIKKAERQLLKERV